MSNSIVYLIKYQITFSTFSLPSSFIFSCFSFTFSCYIMFTFSSTLILIFGLVLDTKLNILNSQISPLQKFLQLSLLDSRLIDQEALMTPIFSRFLHN